MVKYFIERVSDNKWLEHAVNEQQGSWTNDPQKAMRWDTKESAERFLEAGQNEPFYEDWALFNGELIVTEHEFLESVS